MPEGEPAKGKKGKQVTDFLAQAARVRPSGRQLAWYELGSYAFVHFGVNTYTDREWGDGTEPESIFRPEKLDCDQWVSAVKAAGMKGIVLTAKHHDGFCLWPSAFTEHSVKNSPGCPDVVRACAEACSRGGIRFGFYLSPWDRNSPLYGTEEYNNYFCAQLEELLTGYGPIFCVWFDNACGEGPNGKKQIYDFERYIALIRKHQPQAVIFNDFGPDIRWCGNEAGKPRRSEWAVVPGELCKYARLQTGPGPLAGESSLDYLYNTDETMGELPTILRSRGLVFTPAEINTSIRPGWFWHEQEEPKELETLFRIWLTSVGGNACLHLNVPPNREGLVDPRDARRLAELGELLRREFGRPVYPRVTGDFTYASQPVYSLQLEEAPGEIRYVELKEDLAEGQRIESFQIEARGEDGRRFPLYQGTTVGYRKICPLRDPFTGQNPLTRTFDRRIPSLQVRITAARGEVRMKDPILYAVP